MSAGVRFVVYGDAKSAGSKRAFRNPKTGALIVTEMVKGAKSWQGAVAAAGAEAHRGPLLDGPLRVVFTFYRPRPRSHYGAGRNAGAVKPSAPQFPSPHEARRSQAGPWCRGRTDRGRVDGRRSDRDRGAAEAVGGAGAG
jgi:hypothetical protein